MGLKTTKVSRYRRTKSDSNTLKSEHTSTKGVENTNKVTDWHDYLNTMSLKMEPANDASIKRLALRLVTWARECPDAWTITQFLNMEGVSRKVFAQWRVKSPELQEAFEAAVSIIGDRRELKLKDDYTHLRFMQPYYSEEVLAEDNRKAKQRKEEDDKKSFKIELNTFPSSALVPERKKDD